MHEGDGFLIKQPGFELNPKELKLRFLGDCLEVLPLCEGLCCRNPWKIYLTAEEYKSSLYQAECLCNLTDRPCDKNLESCPHLRYILAKKEDKSCVYLNNENRCSIYKDRPLRCRNFFCSGGWRLVSVFPPDNLQVEGPADPVFITRLTKETFISSMKTDRIFVLHPLVGLKTIFYLPEKKKIIFVKKIAGGCGIFRSEDEFFHPGFDEQKILDFARAFASKKNLGDIVGEFNTKYRTGGEPEVLYEILWLLNKHNIIIDSSYFAHLLGGMGSVMI